MTNFNNCGYANKIMLRCKECNILFVPIFQDDIYCNRCFAEEDGYYDNLIEKDKES